MSLMRNLTKAKQVIDKQKASGKLSNMVDKATDGLDKVTKGRSAKLSEKIDTAAHKFDGTYVAPERSPDDSVAETDEAADTADSAAAVATDNAAAGGEAADPDVDDAGGN
jgi:hypothetical protein